MYHICPSRCQTQFVRTEGSDRGKGGFAPNPAEFAVELAAAVRGGLARMDEGQHLALANRLLDLGGTKNDLPGLVGEGEQAERGLHETSLDNACKALRNLDFCLQGTGEDLALF